MGVSVGIGLILWGLVGANAEPGIRAVWRATGSSTLPVGAVGTPQWVDILLETDEIGLERYSLQLLIFPQVSTPTGVASASPPAPLEDPVDGADVSESLVSGFDAVPGQGGVLTRRVSAVIGSVEVVVTGVGLAVEPLVATFVGADGAPIAPVVEGAMVGSVLPPTRVASVEYTFEVIATTEDPRFTSFGESIGGDFSNNGELVFKAAVPVLAEIPDGLFRWEGLGDSEIAAVGGKFTFFGDPSVYDSGHVTILAGEAG